MRMRPRRPPSSTERQTPHVKGTETRKEWSQKAKKNRGAAVRGEAADKVVRSITLQSVQGDTDCSERVLKLANFDKPDGHHHSKRKEACYWVINS